MPVDAFRLQTATPIRARRHPRDQLQRLQFLLGRCDGGVVLVRAGAAVQTGRFQEVDVAEFGLFETADFVFEVFGGRRVDALAFAVAGDVERV